MEADGGGGEVEGGDDIAEEREIIFDGKILKRAEKEPLL